MSDENPRVPVLIVGGGPAGLITANELLRRGVACRVIDKMAGPSQLSRAFTLHSRTMEMFEHMGIAHRYLERGNPAKGFTFNFRNRPERPVLDFTGLPTRYNFVLIHNQNETERWLREHLEGTYNFSVEWQTRLTEVAQDAGGVTAKVVHHDDNDREEVIHARYLIGCDGVHSLVRTQMGAEFEGQDYLGMVLQNMDVTLDGWEAEEDWVHFYMDRDDFMLVVRLPGRNYRLLISDMGELADETLSAREAFQIIMDRHCDGVGLGRPDWASKWEIWARQAKTYRDGNIFLAGDSAHVHSPSGGQGMNAATQDGFNLGWKLAMAIKGEAREEILDSYQAERYPIDEQVIAGASVLHEIMMAHGKDVEERIAMTQEADWHDTAVGRVSGISYTYRDYITPVEGLQTMDGPANGDRMPDAPLDETTRIFDLTRSPKFTLLLFAGDTSDKEIGTLTKIADLVGQKYGHCINCYAITPAPVENLPRHHLIVDEQQTAQHQLGRGEEGRLYLVRPDGYIAFRSLFSDAGKLMNYLESILL